jgi:ATP-binding cassette subfamily B (MDR/TAP) protein 1
MPSCHRSSHTSIAHRQAFVSAFAHVPKLAGVLFALIPTTMIMFTVLGAWSEKAQDQRSPLDGATSSFIEQMLSSVRVVQSFDMGKHLLIKLEYTMLKPLRKMSTKVATSKAFEQAAAYGVAFLVYSMCFWYGGISVENGTTVGDVMTVRTIVCAASVN